MKKNEEFIITIEDMSEDGSGVGKQGGYIWFIKDTVIGDVEMCIRDRFQGRRGRSGRCLIAPENSLNPGYQLFGVKRFDHIIICPQLLSLIHI